MHRDTSRGIGLLLVLVGGIASASDLPPWRDAEDLPIPDDAHSVLVSRADQPILADADEAAPRRGAAASSALLPLYGARRGRGCSARWLNVGALAWVCEDGVTLSAAMPDPRPVRAPVFEGLPFRYFFVGREGSNGYSNLDDADEVAPDQQFEPGFAVAVVEERTKGGQPFVRTHHQMWLPARDLVAASATSFHGEPIEGDDLALGWVVEDRAPLFRKPDLQTKAPGQKRRFEKIAVLEERRVRDQIFVRIGEAEWLRGRDIRRPSRAAPPAEADAGERWIDVELASQTLVAYEGERAVFATLVSAGRGASGTELGTPRGVHRIWVKLQSANMDNLEDEGAEHSYAIEDVPYVQYFDNGVGLHGAFWHRAFGHAHSHGCVNLAPIDAERLFAFTSPPLPVGWTAVLPTDLQRGTLVRVR